MKAVAIVIAVVLSGCASVSASKRDQVERAQQIGPYSYQRAFEGPGR